MGLYTLKPVRVFIIYYTCQCNVMSSKIKRHLATCAVTLLLKVVAQRLRELQPVSCQQLLKALEVLMFLIIEPTAGDSAFSCYCR